MRPASRLGRGAPSHLGHRPGAPRGGFREGSVKELGHTVKEPSIALLTSANRSYEGCMTDLIYVLVTLASFMALALLVGVLDRTDRPQR